MDKVNRFFETVENNGMTGEDVAMEIMHYWGTQELEQFMEHLHEEGYYVEGIEDDEE